MLVAVVVVVLVVVVVVVVRMTVRMMMTTVPIMFMLISAVRIWRRSCIFSFVAADPKGLDFFVPWNMARLANSVDRGWIELFFSKSASCARRRRLKLELVLAACTVASLCHCLFAHVLTHCV